MICKQIFGLLMLLPLAVSQTVVISDYSKASESTKQLVDKISDNYQIYSVLEVLKNIPKLEDPEKCNQNKVEYVDNIKLLLQENNIEVTQDATGGVTLEIDTKNGKKLFPYIEKKEGEPVVCQKMMTPDTVQEALRSQLLEASNKLSVEKLQELRNNLLQQPVVNQLTNVVNTGATGFVSLREMIRKQEEGLNQMVLSFLGKSPQTNPAPEKAAGQTT